MSEKKEDSVSKSQNDDVDAAIVVEDSSEPGGGGDGGGGGGGGSSSRVKGPWSPEEDAVLSRLVSQFGARNWGMIARGIPGRSGKSCRLRWCNQLDPCLKRKPFTGNSTKIALFVYLKKKESFLQLFSCFFLRKIGFLMKDLKFSIVKRST